MIAQSYAIGLITILASLSLAAKPLDSHFGVKPSLYDVYSKFTISCQGKGSIPISRVNDDYCDCPEKGEDEPGTSACSNGIFFCKNIGSRAIEIGSWKVNDGICDCCDGSDEYIGLVNCPNTCQEEGRAIKEQLKALSLTLKQGLEQKQRLVRQGESLKDNQLKKLEDLQHQIEIKNTEVEKRRQKSLEADEAEKAEIAQQSPPVAEKNPESSENLAQEKQTEITEAKTPDAQDDTVHSSFPYPVQYAYTESSQEASSSESFPNPEQYAPQKGSEAEPKTESEPEQEQHAILEEQQVSKEEVKPKEAEPESPTMKVAREARQALKDAEDELNTLRKEVNDIKAFLQIDYGPSNAYRTLQSECFTTTHDKYTYKLCPFKDVSQIESHATSLGIFQRWSDDRTQWLFDHGQKCWNGPERSMKVKLICGLRNQILSVHEPSTCVYEMQFETPASCSQEEADILDSKLGELTQPEHFRDEL